jgi:SSS family solute:Na+ symporter
MIDNIIVFAYLLIILGMGIYYRSRSNNFKHYANLQSSKNTSKLILVATIFASSIGGGTTFGISEKVFASSAAYTYGLILTIPIDFLIAIYIIPRIIKHHGAETVGDIMASYYGRPGRFIAGVAAMIVSIGLLAAQISVSGRIFQYILAVDYIKAVIISYSIVIIYTTIGGLRSVVFTNVLQFFAMILAIPVISIVGIHQIGIYNFIEQLPQNKILFDNSNTLLQDTIAATAGFAVMGLYPSFIQRILINTNYKETSKAIYIKSFIYALFLIFVTTNGLIAYHLYPEQTPQQALPYLIEQIMPVGLQGFIIVGLLAAVMSTADSDLNITSITLVKDFLSPIFDLSNQGQLLLIARIANIIIGSSAIIIALNFASVVDLVVFVVGFWSPMIIVPLIFALFGVTISQKMMIFSSICGVFSFLLWEKWLANYLNLNLKGVFIGTMVNLLIFSCSVLSTKWCHRT